MKDYNNIFIKDMEEVIRDSIWGKYSSGGVKKEMV